MKLNILATAVLLTPLCLAAAAKAANPDHVKQLLNTNACIKCDLTNVDLMGANLKGANLEDRKSVV